MIIECLRLGADKAALARLNSRYEKRDDETLPDVSLLPLLYIATGREIVSSAALQTSLALTPINNTSAI